RTTACALLTLLALAGCASPPPVQPDPPVAQICPAPPPPPAWTLQPPKSLQLFDKSFGISAQP
ncbi:MAG TPA: hypothetical protein VMS38_08745, partial [Pseudorhodoferax sp.]|nr:hypothetical protein [Pseudorhodoferax sp.]